MKRGWCKTEIRRQIIPLQVKEDDLAIFLQKSAFEIIFDDEKYFVVPQNSILLPERGEAFL